MIDLQKPIPISNRRAIVGYDPERKLAIIDSKGLRMSSMKYLGEFDPSDSEIDAIEQFESEMRRGGQLTEAFCATGKGGKVDNSCSPKNKGSRRAYGKKAPDAKDLNDLLSMSLSEIEKFERSVRMNRIRITSDSYAIQMRDIALARWQKHAEHPEYVRLTDLMKRSLSGEHFDEANGSGKNSADYFADKRTEFFKRAEADYLGATRAKLYAEHARGVRNALKDKRDVPDEVLREYIYSDWMPQDTRDRLLGRPPKDEVIDRGDEYSIAGKSAPAPQNRTQFDTYQSRVDLYTTQESEQEAREKIKALASDPAITKLSKKIESMERVRNSKAKELYAETEERVAKYRKKRDELTDVIEKMKQDNAPADEIESKTAEWKQAVKEAGSAYVTSEKQKREWKKQDLEKVVKDLTVRKDERLRLVTSTSLKTSSVNTLKDARVSYEELQARIDQAREIVHKITAKRAGLEGAFVNIEIDPDNTRAFYDPKKEKVVIGPTSGVGTIAHEIGHALEYAHPGQTTRSKSWLAVANEGGTVLGIGTNSTKFGQLSEVYYGSKIEGQDAQYARKLYDGRATELVSQGYSRLIDDPDEFVTDDSHFRFFTGWLRGD
jgi:hypothetical protein